MILVELLLIFNLERYLSGQHSLNICLNNLTQSTDFGISWEPPSNCVAKWNNWNEENGNDEANVTRFNFKCLHCSNERREEKEFQLRARLTFSLVLYIFLPRGLSAEPRFLIEKRLSGALGCNKLEKTAKWSSNFQQVERNVEKFNLTKWHIVGRDWWKKVGHRWEKKPAIVELEGRNNVVASRVVNLKIVET